MQKVIREHCTDIKADFQKGIDKFKNLCQIIKEAGYPPKDAWDCIKEELKDYIPKSTLYRWSDEIIPEAKALTRPKKIPNLGISGVPLAKDLGRLPIKPLKRRCQLANEWHSLTLIAFWCHNKPAMSYLEAKFVTIFQMSYNFNARE